MTLTGHINLIKTSASSNPEIY